MTTTERLMQLAEAWADAAKEAARSEEIDTAAIYAMHVGLRCEAEAAFRSALSSTLEAKEAREALEPFARAAARYGRYGIPPDFTKIEGEFPESLTVGDIHRADRAYRKLSGEQP